MVSCLDILQEPRWGRSEESFGEDPYLAARMCENVVRGFQGEDPDELKSSNKIIAVLKHLCGFGNPIGAHSGICSNIGEREMREIHLQGMKAGVRAGALGCMADVYKRQILWCYPFRIQGNASERSVKLQERNDC